MKNKTVIILNDYCNINGGASKVAIDEAVGLAAAGVRVIFVGACAPVCSELLRANLKIVCLGQKELIKAGKNPLVMLQGLWNFKAARTMRVLLQDLDRNDTIVHLHGYTKALSTSPVRVADNMGFKVVCTLHDFFSACPNGALFDYVQGRPCPKLAMSIDCIKTQCDKRHYAHKLYRVLRTFIQKKFGGLPSRVKDYITLSKKSVELLRPYLPRDARYYQLENPIDVPHLPPVKVEDNKWLVVVGRLDAEKGIEILLEAARRAKVYLTFVGDGPLRKIIEPCQFCRITGWVSPQQVVEELGKARAIVFPSLWYETFGLVVAEAAARGVPAIVSDISAASERVEDGQTGWHIRSGSVNDLTRALSLTNDDEVIKRAGADAYKKFWASPPVVTRHVGELQNIYERIFLRDDTIG